jgi:nucleoside-diphosphate-sugar epimerase
MRERASTGLHVIFGTGPAGCWTARALCGLGMPVRAVNRSGRRPALLPDGVQLGAADLTDPQQAMAAAEGAAVMYQALNPPYDQWPQAFPALQNASLAAARAHNARYVSIENLYVYDGSQTMREDTPIAPRSRKGALRAEMAEQVRQAHQRGDVETVALRSSDYYGPGVTLSALGQMVFGNLVAGKKAQLIGSASQPHSFAYIEDVGAAAAALGSCDDVTGKLWFAPHAPAITQGEMLAIACRTANLEKRVTVISPFMMRLAGLFMPMARASVEMIYQFTKPFVVDANRIERELDMHPTPIETGLERTVRWYTQSAA